MKKLINPAGSPSVFYQDVILLLGGLVLMGFALLTTLVVGTRLLQRFEAQQTELITVRSEAVLATLELEAESLLTDNARLSGLASCIRALAEADPVLLFDETPPALMQAHGVNAVLLFDADGNYLGGRAQFEGDPAEVSEATVKTIGATDLLQTPYATFAEGRIGFLPVDQYLYLAAGHPVGQVLDGSEILLGYSVLLRRLTDEEVRRLAELSQARIAFHLMTPEGMPDVKYLTDTDVFGGGGLYMQHGVDAGEDLPIFALLNDLTGQPVVLVNVVFPPEMTDTVHRANRFLQIAMGFQALLLVVFAFFIGMELRRRRLIAFEHREQGEALRKSKLHVEELTGKALAADRAKSAFIAMMSHEIRTPLNAVLGYCDLLEHSRLSEDQRAYVKTIHTSGRSLLVLLNDILDLSKVEAGNIDLLCEPLAPVEVVREAVRLFEPSALALDAKLTFNTPENAPQKVAGDPIRLRQVLCNLIANALKHTPGGEVRLELDFPTEALGRNAGDGVWLRVAVRDNGPGIPADKRGKLFEPFTRLDAESSPGPASGTGLGLAICRWLCRGMGGDIWLEDTKEPGSHFIFVIHCPPLGEASGAGEDEREGPGLEHARGLRALVVDDNETNVRLLTEFLKRHGLHVDTAAAGEAGVENYTAKHHDLVFMDVQMPGVDGLEAARRIRKHEVERALPPCWIVGVSAADTPEDVQNCLEAGMTSHLAKPLDPARIAETLRDVAEKIHNRA